MVGLCFEPSGGYTLFNTVSGEPADYAQYLSIDKQTGVPSVIKPLAESNAAAFFVIVEVRHDDVIVCFSMSAVSLSFCLSLSLVAFVFILFVQCWLSVLLVLLLWSLFFFFFSCLT